MTTLNTVNAEIALVPKPNVDSEASGLSVQVNCSHGYDQSDTILLKITVLQNDVSNNDIISSFRISCEDKSYASLDYLKCDTFYDLMVSWIPTADIDEDITECQLNHVTNKKVACPGK